MWVYKQTEPRLWTVGHYDPDGKFQPESDHPSAERAGERVHYLNGGDPPLSTTGARYNDAAYRPPNHPQKGATP